MLKLISLSLAFALTAVSQTPAVQLTMSNITVKTGSGGSADIVIASAPGSEPAGLQFTLSFPNGIFKGRAVVAGAAATAAGKQLACDATLATCIVWGLNANTIQNGVLATVQFTSSGTVGTYPIPVNGTVAADAKAALISSTGVVGTFTVIPLSFDLNGDGKIDALDAKAELDQILGVAPCSSDFNADTKCNLQDLLLLVQAAVAPTPGN